MNNSVQLGNANRSSQPTTADDLTQPSSATTQHLDDALRSATFGNIFWCGDNVQTSPLDSHFLSGQFSGTDHGYKPGIDNGSEQIFGDCNLAVKALTNVAVDTLEGNSTTGVAASWVPQGLDPMATVLPPHIQSTLNLLVLSASSKDQYNAQFNPDSNPGSPLFSPASATVDLPYIEKAHPARVCPPEHKGKERQKDDGFQKWTDPKVQPQKSLPKTSLLVNHPATSSTSLFQGKVNDASTKGLSKARTTPISQSLPVFPLDVDLLKNPPGTDVQQQPLPVFGTTSTPVNNANVTSIPATNDPRVKNSALVSTSSRVNGNIGQRRAGSSNHTILAPETIAHDLQPTHISRPSSAAPSTLPVRNDQPSGTKKRKRAESSSTNPSANSEPSAPCLPTATTQVPIQDKPKLKRRRTEPNVNAQSTSSLGANVVPSGPPPGQAMTPAMAAAGPLATHQGNEGQNQQRSGVPAGAFPPLNRTPSAGGYLGDQALGYHGQSMAAPAMSSGQVLSVQVDTYNNPQTESIDGRLMANPTIPNSAQLEHNVLANAQMPQAFNNPNVNSKMSMPAFLSHPSNSRGISVDYASMSPQRLAAKYQYHRDQALAIQIVIKLRLAATMVQQSSTAVPASTPPSLPNFSSNQTNQNPSLTNSHHQGSHSRPQTPAGNHFAGGNGNMQVGVHSQIQRNDSYNGMAGPSHSLQRNMVNHIAPQPAQPASSNATAPGLFSGWNVPFAHANTHPGSGVKEQRPVAISSVVRESAKQSRALAHRG